MSEPPELPPDQPRSSEEEGDSGYQRFAETVGGVPSFRKRDNIVQAIVVLSTTAIGAVAGFVFGGGYGSLSGMLAGLVVGALGSGLVLMVLGWIRASGRRK